MPTPSSDLIHTREEDLQDLPRGDAEELRAFLEKRKWFEGKLQLLETLVPIYPFVHLHLANDSKDSPSGGFSRVGEDESEWKLPTSIQLQSWQEERDALEEEVLAFDGGDLARMKEKTRVATQLPLTPPSTHLVAITLDLIVLVDRLLTLLRHRSELLELTGLRLEWDELRWKTISELKALRREIAEVMKEKCTWLPGTEPSDLASTSQSELQPRTKDATPITPKRVRDGERSNTPGGPADSSSCQTPIRRVQLSTVDGASSPTTPTRFSSPTSNLASVSTPLKRDPQLYRLHTHVVNLQFRHRVLRTTTHSKTGATLDRIIDIAGPLKGLGGLSEPQSAENGDGGVVPEELLDLQDDLDSDVERVAGDVQTCKDMEQQCLRAEKYHSDCLRAQSAAESVIETLKTAIAAKDLSEDKRQGLFDAQSVAQNLLPSSPASDHSDGGDHAVAMAATLTAVSSTAVQAVQGGQEAVEWYGTIVSEREELSSTVHLLDRAGKELSQWLKRTPQLDLQPMSLARSDVPDRPSKNDDGDVRLDANSITHSGWLLQARQNVGRTEELSQRYTSQVARFRAIYLGPPKSIRDHVTLPDDEVLLAARESANRVFDQTREMRQKIAIVGKEAEVQPLVARCLGTMADLDRRAGEALAAIEIGIGQTLYTGPGQGFEPDLSDLRDLVASLERDFQNDLRRDWLDLEARLSSTVKWTTLEQDLRSRYDGLNSRLMEATRQSMLYERVHEQTIMMALVESEAAGLMGKARSLLSTELSPSADEPTPPNGSDDGQVNNLLVLAQHIHEWESSLASRIPFLSSSGTASLSLSAAVGQDTASLKTRRTDPTSSSSAPPLTPPDTPTLGHHPRNTDESIPTLAVEQSTLEQWNLRETDLLVRQRANELVSRVKGVLDHATTIREESRSRSNSFREESKTPSRSSSFREESTTHAAGDLDSVTGDAFVSQEAYSNAQHTLGASFNSPSRIPRLSMRSFASGPGDFTTRSVSSPIPQNSEYLLRSIRGPRGSLLSQSGPPRPMAKAKDMDTSKAPKARPRSSMPMSLSQSHSRLTLSTKTAARPTSAASMHVPKTRSSMSHSASTRSITPTCRSIEIRTPNSSADPPHTLSRSSRMSLTNVSTFPTGPFAPALKSSSSRLSLGGSGSSTHKGKRKEYVADPSSQLDVAVGKIVNDLKVDVPIIPIGLRPESGSRSQSRNGSRPNLAQSQNPAQEDDAWQDLSGRYWIGAEGRAKLCFCRILRSSAVMVRVGGGWEELSKFLLDHFAETVASFRPFSAGSGPELGSDTAGSRSPLIITSSSLASDLAAGTTASNDEAGEISAHAVTPGPAVVTLGDATPPMGNFLNDSGLVNLPASADNAPASVGASATPLALSASIPLTTSGGDINGTAAGVNIVTPSKIPVSKSNANPRTPASGEALRHALTSSLASPLTPDRLASSHSHSGPLVPLQFIRRASDSPPVRQKEKEQFGARRSVLGREAGSTTSPRKHGETGPGGISRSSSGDVGRFS